MPLVVFKKAPLFTFATWNPADKGAQHVLSNGDLTSNWVVSASTMGARSTIGKSSGKWFWEVTVDTATQGLVSVGIKQPATNLNFRSVNTQEVTYFATDFPQAGKKTVNFSDSAYGSFFSQGDVIGVALDMDAGTCTFYKNGVSQGIALSGLTGTHFAYLTLFTSTGGEQATTNFGATPFAFAVPPGFNAGLYS